MNFQVDLAPSLGALLTSGYLPFHPLPGEATKCAFGGTRDEGETGGVGGGGGINKATGNSCYSPHADEHQDAANLAVQVRAMLLLLLFFCALAAVMSVVAAAVVADVVVVVVA